MQTGAWKYAEEGKSAREEICIYIYISIYLNEMEEMSDNSKDMEIVSSYWKPVPSKKQK